MIYRRSAMVTLLLLLQGCDHFASRTPSSRVYALYSNSMYTDERVHIATFDAKQSDPEYNAINCEQVRAAEEAFAERRPVAAEVLV